MKESRNNTHPNSPKVFPAPDTLKLIISVSVRDKGGKVVEERKFRDGIWRSGQKLKREMGGKGTTTG